MPRPSSTESCQEPPLERHLSRREFGRRAVLAATTAAILPASLLSQEAEPKPTSSTEQAPKPAAALPAELRAEGELKYQWIIQTYGKRLNEEQKQDLHRLIMEGQESLAAFRAFPLENGNMPATVLKFTEDANSPAGGGD